MTKPTSVKFQGDPLPATNPVMKSTVVSIPSNMKPMKRSSS